MKKYIAISTVLFSANVMAASDLNKTIDHLGIQASTSYYFSVKEGLSTNCLFNVIYVPMSNDFGKGAYSMLLLSKASGKPIGFDYTQDANGACTLQKIDMI